MSRKMNDKKAIDKMKNLLADFRMLATKVNEDNKNKNKNLEEIKQILEACKKEYQKLLYEHEALKKNTMNQNQKKVKTQTQIKKLRKRKYYVVNEHDNYESDKESDAYASTDDNEHDSNHENDVDDNQDYYFTPVKKRRNNKKVYAKKIKQQRKQLPKKKKQKKNNP